MYSQVITTSLPLGYVSTLAVNNDDGNNGDCRVIK